MAHRKITTASAVAISLTISKRSKTDSIPAGAGAGGYIGGVPGIITATAMTSPRLVGESAYKLGQIVNAIERHSNKINELVNIGGITTKKEVK